MIEIYVDGSAINNENPNVPTLGGVGVAIIEDGRVHGVRIKVSNHTLQDSQFPLNLKQTTKIFCCLSQAALV